MVIFHLDDREFALPIAQVMQVVRMVALTPIPDAPVWMSGLINLRGQVTPVIDLRARLGMKPLPPRPTARILIVQCGARVFGLVADTVNLVVSIPRSEMESSLPFGEYSNFVSAIARWNRRLVLILELDRVCAGAEPAASVQENARLF